MSWLMTGLASGTAALTSAALATITALGKPMHRFRAAMADTEPLEADKALVRAHYDAVINAFDPDAIRVQVAEGFYDHRAGTRSGPEGVIEHARALHAAFADLSVRIQAMVAERNLIAVRAEWSGRHIGSFRGIAPTGRRFTCTGMVFWRVESGRIAERWAEVDMIGALTNPE